MLHSVQDSMGSATSVCVLELPDACTHDLRQSSFILEALSVSGEEFMISGMGASAACMTHAGLEHIQARAGASAAKAAAFAALPPEQQQALEQENQALVSELSSLNQASEQSPSSPNLSICPLCIELSRSPGLASLWFSLVQLFSLAGRKVRLSQPAPRGAAGSRYAAWRLRTCLLLHASWTTVLKPFYLLIRSLLEAYSDSGMVKAGL